MSALPTFVTIFLGIFIEAVPFLLAGSVVSGLLEVFVDQDDLQRLIPRNPFWAAVAGAGLGFAFPVCECGVVPVTRRLYRKGLPLSVGIAFLFAAPVVNPIVIASTYAAFGWGPILVARVGFSLVIAVFMGWIFGLAKPSELLLPEVLAATPGMTGGPNLESDRALAVSAIPKSLQMPAYGTGTAAQMLSALRLAGDDFIDMGRYLVAGALLAALMQTVVPQSALLAIGRGPVVSVVALLVLAFVLSVCSTVDAFLALSFANSFTSGAILGFLVFGPMVDIKSTLMFLGVFQRRAVVYMVLLPLAFAMLVALFWNLNLR